MNHRPLHAGQAPPCSGRVPPRGPAAPGSAFGPRRTPHSACPESRCPPPRPAPAALLGQQHPGPCHIRTATMISVPPLPSSKWTPALISASVMFDRLPQLQPAVERRHVGGGTVLRHRPDHRRWPRPGHQGTGSGGCRSCVARRRAWREGWLWSCGGPISHGDGHQICVFITERYASVILLRISTRNSREMPASSLAAMTWCISTGSPRTKRPISEVGILLHLLGVAHHPGRARPRRTAPHGARARTAPAPAPGCETRVHPDGSRSPSDQPVTSSRSPRGASGAMLALPAEAVGDRSHLGDLVEVGALFLIIEHPAQRVTRRGRRPPPPPLPWAWGSADVA